MSKFKRAFSYSLSAILMVLLIFVLLNRQNTLDWLSLIGYTPPDDIVLLAEKSSMSEKSKRIFYVHKPEILNGDAFNKYCTKNEETIVLGCYNGLKIYIFNVSNPQLEGIKEVTAAHEMLHAQYDRLSANKKAEVNSLLELQLSKLTDMRIKKNLEAYRKKDPSIVLNEAHSIFATEVKDLNPALETYYKDYFIDRKKIVSISESYESIFTGIKTQVENYDNSLRELKIDIDYREQDLEIRARDLTSWSSDLDSMRKSNSISEYNSQVYSYNSAVDEYRKDLNILKQKIAEYNSIVIKRNELAMQQNELYESVDSRAKDL